MKFPLVETSSVVASTLTKTERFSRRIQMYKIVYRFLWMLILSKIRPRLMTVSATSHYTIHTIRYDVVEKNPWISRVK